MCVIYPFPHPYISSSFSYLLSSQLYKKRKNFLKGEDEKAKWAELCPAYMTEESEAEGDIIRQHPLKWRSPGNIPQSNY